MLPRYQGAGEKFYFGSTVHGQPLLVPDRGRSTTEAALPSSGSGPRAHTGCRTRPALFCVFVDRCSQDIREKVRIWGQKCTGRPLVVPARGRSTTEAALPSSGSGPRAHTGCRTRPALFCLLVDRCSQYIREKVRIWGQNGLGGHLWFLIEVDPRPRPRCRAQGAFPGPTRAVERARHSSVWLSIDAPQISGRR
jgi:hypothetical protein